MTEFGCALDHRRPSPSARLRLRRWQPDHRGGRSGGRPTAALRRRRPVRVAGRRRYINGRGAVLRGRI